MMVAGHCGSASRPALRRASLAVLLVALLTITLTVLPDSVEAWQKWDFYDRGDGSPFDPGPRKGHSFHLFNNTLILFGGKSNDILQEHVPKTYEVETVNGTLQFKTYEDKPVQEACANLTSPDCTSVIPVGLYWNDIWEYPLDCVRWSDLSCREEGWRVIDPGAVLGGCLIISGDEVCTHPTERFDHSSELFDDGTLIIYGGFSRRCEDYCADVWEFSIPDCKWNGNCVWKQLSELGRSGPGRRWRAGTVRVGEIFYLFGGQRQWHGFGTTNSVENKWTDTFQYALGGYLDDLWEYRRETNEWYEIPRISSCFPNPGIEWAERFNTRCLVFWPPQRAGHVLLHYHSNVTGNATLLVHGGYRTFFPYPHTNARGAGPGTATVGSDGFTPYPTYPFYLNDLWEYNFYNGKWQEIEPIDDIIPAARMEHSIIIAGDVFILFGGYRSNYYFGDLWLYNLTTQTWLEKSNYVHALYPGNCTDDTIIDANGDEQVKTMSVFGEPTRGTALDGAHGRAVTDVFVLQPRRRAPGWDGCRDRFDGRPDLPVSMQWSRPSQRSGHRSIWSEKHRLMLVYGGQAFVLEQQKAFDITHATHVEGDMWQHHIDHCPKNCSGQGRCFHGYCYCDDGFYGIDCSNISCPGSWCYMDTARHVQICKHCCHAAYTHTDGEYYVEDERKTPCSDEFPGESHGICDGFGHCQCAPPYMTRDCSVRDCPNNCSFNGWCDIQYPVGRCMCDDGWIGKDCSERICMNNCTWPNGECVDGDCVCVKTLNPYNRTRDWYYYNGTDCSFVVPFAAASRATWMLWQLAVVLFAAAALHVTSGVGEADNASAT